MTVKSLFAFGLLIACSQAVHSQVTPPEDKKFFDTPANHWAFEGQAYLKSQGLLIGFPDGLGYVRVGSTRYEMATVYHAAATNLIAMTRPLEELREKISTDTPGSSEAKRDESAFQDAIKGLSNPLLSTAKRYLARGLKEFSPELIKLGESAEYERVILGQFQTIMSELDHPVVGSALKQFPDVPTGHWAAQDVLELRRWGLLQGYPGGLFGG